jgi:hypothetical protein
MRFELNGMSVLYGTSDALAPGDTVDVGAPVKITTGVQPPSASNNVVVQYRVNGGPTQTVIARWLRHDPTNGAQYFMASLPAFQLGDTVEYIVACHCAGRQVPSPDEAKQFPSSFHVIAGEDKPLSGRASSANLFLPTATPMRTRTEVSSASILAGAPAAPVQPAEERPQPASSSVRREISAEVPPSGSRPVSTVQPGSPVLPVGPQPRPLGSSSSTVTSQHRVEGRENVPLTESPDVAADIRRTRTLEYASRAGLDNRIANQLLEKDLTLDRVDAAALSQVIEADAEGTHVASPREAGSTPESVDERAKAATDAASDQSVVTSRDMRLQLPSAPGAGSRMASQLGLPDAESIKETTLGPLPNVQESAEPTTPLASTAAPKEVLQSSGNRPSAAAQASPIIAVDATPSAAAFPSETAVAGLSQTDKEQVRPATTSGLGAFQIKRFMELKGSTSTLQVSVAPEAGVEVTATVGTVFLDVVYTRAIGGAASTGLVDLPDTVQETVRARLDETLRGTLELADVAPSSKSIDLYFLAANGSVRLRKTIAPASESSMSLSIRSGIPLSVSLSAAEVAAIVAQDPPLKPSTPLIDRRAYFVPVGDQRMLFAGSTLQIAPVWVGNGGWKQLGLDQLFHADLAITTAVPWNGALWAELSAIPWTSSHLAVDGRFSFSFPKGSGDAWIWWLSGSLAAIGVVLDDLCAVRVTSLGVPLPPFSGAASSGAGPTRVPANFTEAEVASNPHIYTEDPGEFCKPFKNPERVLGERSFFVIVRAEQPVISAQASVQQDPLPTFTTHNFPTVRAYRADAATTFHESAVRSAGSVPGVMVAPVPGAIVHQKPGVMVDSVPGVMVDPIPGIMVDPVPGALIDNEAEVTFVRQTLPISYLDALRRSNRGRTELDATHPIQWEGDISRYQATTVARGHILEFRMRWRSNGYSLGTVAKTLTLAPRQTKRIQKIEWRRSELARRQETTRLFDQVSDTVSRERVYDDSVQANLSEWAHGESDSSMSAVAGGFGFAYAGFIGGGGGGHSHADSSSSQEGGRQTTASEEQRLRDSIRRYGDSLRKLDSLVVNEVTQEETATGTTEVVRNANYGHSLTVIYYQILRHLKIETGVAGVRECLFVPFAITPFTVQRAYRWRESIQRGLRDPQYAGAIKYLKDVSTNFANSDVPPGRRSEQPVRYIYGSLFIKLAIERPRDKEPDGSFDVATWTVVRPYLGSPALSIFNRLKALEEHQRDAVFQQQHAGVIAASWVNTLQIDAGGPPLNADFTLATRYQFNGVARVDFSIAAPSGVTRETLASIRVKAGKDLPPGSVANLQSLTFTYETDQFQRTVSASQGAGDLVEVETGVRDAGATIGTIPDTWERRDVRAEMIYAVQGLIEHLNEHVEYYTKVTLWSMDRDRLWMLIDGFYVPGTNQISIASVVERDPIAIIGNALVFRVSAGSFLGIGDIKTPAELFNHYVSLESPSEPMLISLPTDGLYAQTIMDECGALEEHFGNTDWVLNDPDPALGEIAPELLASRRAEPQATQPTQLPQTIINLQNAPEAPAPSGLAGALSAVTTPNAFRDMAGLAGTQANAAAAFQTAANLATNFGNQAAALKLAEMAKDAHATQTADQKLATVQRAADKNLVTGDEAQRHASQILESLHAPSAPVAPHETKAAGDFMDTVRSKLGVPLTSATMETTTPQGAFKVQLASAEIAADGGGGGGAPPVDPFPSEYPTPFTLDPALDTKLTEAIAAATEGGLNSDIPISIVVLKADGHHLHAGNRHEEMHFSGSMIKIAAMYAAHEMRAAANRVFGGTPPKTSKDAIAELVRGMNPQIAANAAKEIKNLSAANLTKVLQPDYATAFKLPPPAADNTDFTNSMKGFLTSMIVNGTNRGAANTIHAVGFGYLTAALIKGGFFKPDPVASKNKGLWLAGDFLDAGDTGNWTEDGRVGCINDTDTAQGTTTIQMAKLITLMVDRKLVDGMSSDAMLKFLKDARDHGFKPWILRSKAGPANFKVTHNKLGEGFLKPANGGKTVMSEASIITDVKGGVARRFVVVWQNVSETGPEDDQFGHVARIVKEFLARV